MIGKKSHMNMTLARRAAECEAMEQLRQKWYIKIVDIYWQEINVKWSDGVKVLLEMLTFGNNIYWDDLAVKAKKELKWTKFYDLFN